MKYLIIKDTQDISDKSLEFAHKHESEFENSTSTSILRYGFIQGVRFAKNQVVSSDDMNFVSDGYHTFEELYNYRRVYNAALFNEWARQGLYDVHKSKLHSDGKEPFGGGWFIVMADLPTGQISNHYELKFWDEFKIPIKKYANVWDQHTPDEALKRLEQFISKE